MSNQIDRVLRSNLKLRHLQLLVAIGVLALWRARRLGPVVTEPLPVVVRSGGEVFEDDIDRAQRERKPDVTESHDPDATLSYFWNLHVSFRHWNVEVVRHEPLRRPPRAHRLRPRHSDRRWPW